MKLLPEYRRQLNMKDCVTKLLTSFLYFVVVGLDLDLKSRKKLEVREFASLSPLTPDFFEYQPARIASCLKSQVVSTLCPP